MDLRKEAQDFAQELTDLLNKTVTTGIRLTPIMVRKTTAVIGYKIAATDLETKGIAVTIGGGPKAYLGISYRLEADHEAKFTRVQSSLVGLFADPDLDQALVHYDYERNKPDGYPEAHLQIDAESQAWNIIRPKNLKDREFSKLHFPVGGRRYRPTVEEIIEFLIVEVKVKSRDGWELAVEVGRKRFEERQLRAAIRRQPELAFDQLKKEGRLIPGSKPGSLTWVP